MPTSLHDLTYRALEHTLVADGLRPAHARTLWQSLYRQASDNLQSHYEFLPPLARWVGEHCGPGGHYFLDELAVAADTESSDGLTQKFLLRLADAQTIETVLMGYTGRTTACVSTQAGCAMGCVFCATGQMGFVRHLRTGEIVAQVLHVQRTLRSRSETGLRNLVLMGMGEPLHNYDAVLAALEIITDPLGLALAPSRVTISTVGVVPGILRLAEENRPFNLAVSLHSADAAARAALVPAGKRWPLEELIGACREYGAKTGRRIFFEWTLIAGANDSPVHARQVAELLAGMHAHVNLIPLNPTNGFAGTASAGAAAHEFQRVLREHRLPSTIRQRRGIDVAAGCGQLRAEKAKTRTASAV